MGLTQCSGAVVVLLRGCPEFSSWWQDSLEALEAAWLAEGARRLRAAFDPRVPKDLVDEAAQRLAEPGALSATLNWYRAVGAVRNAVGIRFGAFSENMKVSFQATRSIG